MAIYLPETTQTSTESLTPREIVAELDKYVVGQPAAKRAVAIALRNRMRRQKLAPEMAEEIAPKNILMIGPTGVGKTEIARRLARLAQSPFVKVEASKFTEVGYVGRDVESMVRDLVELGIDMVRAERIEEVRVKAGQNAEDRLLDLLLPPSRHTAPDEDAVAVRDQQNRTRERFREQLHSGQLDARIVELDVREKSFPSFEIIAGTSVEEVDINLKDMLPGLFQGKTKKRKVKVPEAIEYLTQEEEQKLIDMDSVARTAVDRVQQAGIIFIDEIDKIAGREGSHGPDVSREGVQRDILPIVEGTTVNTKYGMVRTDHILFIAAGAFHVSKPSDLIPELQGRFPIRVELHALGKDEFVRILTEPRSALIKQYTALMETEGIELTFTDDAIHRIAELATIVNDRTENIGARRLHTVMEKLLDEISFEGPDLTNKRVTIDEAYVTKMLAEIVKNEDLSRYILVKFAVAAVLAAVLVAGCGKKGPPLPPLIRLPAPPELRADRRGATVELAVAVPSANADGARPANISRVDIYALTGSPAFTEADLLKHGTRIASIEVNPPPDPDETVEPGQPPKVVAPPPGDGVDQGAKTTVRDRLDASALVPVDLGADKPGAVEAGRNGPLLGPSSAAPLRTYVGVGVNTSGRRGRFSTRVPVSLAPPPPPPPSPTVTYDEKAITVAWVPAASTGAAQNQEEVLPSRPLGPQRPPLAYNVYDSTAGTLLTTTPVTEPRYTDSRIAWGEERCYVVRAIEKTAALSVESEAQAPRCVTLVDTFPPAAPKDLKAVSTEGVISLIWEANPESDLAGYIILRAQAPAEPVTPVVSAPVLETSFNDAVQPGVRFVYAVRAVDKAGNASASSNRVEETAR